jgi:hypothetical protein
MAVTTAIVSGALANKARNGGNAWSRLSWVLGLKRLGFDVCFVEQVSRNSCVDASGGTIEFGDSVPVAYFKSVMEQFGLAGASALICDNGEHCGLPWSELASRARKADLLLNLSGHLTLPELKHAPACKVYYDDDPAFTQFWHASGTAGARLDGHDFFFTLGANIGARECAIPTGGIHWQPTRPPVVLADWPFCAPKVFHRFTTVASWRGAYGPVQHGGKTYGLKVHEFRKFLEMPGRSGHTCEIALLIDPADQKDLDALRAFGWRIVDPKQEAGTADEFRRYVQTSDAEFSAAQGIYVDTNSGWFSDRTVRYLASGRPALVQETGFSRHLPTGEGLLSFRTLDEAVEGAHRIEREYERHCWAARRLAEEYFDSDKVIRRLLDQIGLAAPSPRARPRPAAARRETICGR